RHEGDKDWAGRRFSGFSEGQILRKLTVVNVGIRIDSYDTSTVQMTPWAPKARRRNTPETAGCFAQPLSKSKRRDISS
ncbi:MAG: hypothetical protein O9327_22435, partial [Polaromonas sp.]|nr:hypothetical protein [Polaromonas sp.]